MFPAKANASILPSSKSDDPVHWYCNKSSWVLGSRQIMLVMAIMIGKELKVGGFSDLFVGSCLKQLVLSEWVKFQKVS